MLIRWMIVLGALGVGLLYPLHGDIAADSGQMEMRVLGQSDPANLATEEEVDVQTFQYWVKNQTELAILALIIFANLVVFRIGPQRRARQKIAPSTDINRIHHLGERAGTQ